MKQAKQIDTAAMEKLVAGLTTKSDKIRTLGQAGYARADIARFLDIRYQHVRNVLVQAEESEVPYDAGPALGVWVNIGSDGRLMLPPDYRRLLETEGGGQVFLDIQEGAVRLRSRESALRAVQSSLAPYLSDTSVDAFIAEKQREARRDDDSHENQT